MENNLMARDYVLDLSKVRVRDKFYDLEQWLVRFVHRQPKLNGEKAYCVLVPAESKDKANEVRVWSKLNTVRLFRYFVFHEIRHLVDQYVKTNEIQDDEEITELYEAVQWRAMSFFLAILLEEGEE
jgi:hypothetical protein